MDFGFDDARTHGVDANPLRCHFARQTQREHVDGAFGRRVIDILARRTNARRRAGQVDDGAALAAMAGAHAQHRLARAHDRAQHIDIEHAAQARKAHGVDARGQVHHAGVIDQRVQAAQLGVDASEHAQHLGFVSHVGLNGNSLHAQRPSSAHHLVGSLGVVGVVDRQRPALRRSLQGDRCANAATRTGDKQNFVHGKLAS